MSTILTQFMVEVGLNLRSVHNDWRAGQTYFNTLYDMDPECADMIRGTRFDPFYDDSRIPAFMEEVFGFVPNETYKSIGD
jgi:hypothetical protein